MYLSLLGLLIPCNVTVHYDYLPLTVLPCHATYAPNAETMANDACPSLKCNAMPPAKTTDCPSYDQTQTNPCSIQFRPFITRLVSATESGVLLLANAFAAPLSTPSSSSSSACPRP